MLNFQYLQIINSFIPELNHFYRSERGHPEALYRLLARFAGILTAFSKDISPTELPEYYHDDLSGSIGALDDYIYDLLPILVPVTPAPPPSPKYTLIPLSLVPLSGTRESVYEATVQSRLLTSSYRLYVAFRGQGDQIQLIREIPGQVKIASVNEIDPLIGRSLRGINLEYLPSPPSVIPVRPGYSYFALNPRGDYWDDVQQSGSLAIHVPTAFGEVELELMAVEVEEE
jgi:type VI secretion system protein ImpJ